MTHPTSQQKASRTANHQASMKNGSHKGHVTAHDTTFRAVTMFSVKVELNEKARESAGTSGNMDLERHESLGGALEFSVGNQRVEHVTGVIHLYKKPSVAKGTVSSQVCVLYVPADVGVQEFCHLCGSYLKSIHEMRFLRRENTRETSYMVYLRFSDEEAARSFVEERNGQPFCTFETEVVWKLLYVDSLQFSEDPGPSVGETELPTCPVCLERLDQNVSGVVVTMCNHVFHNECLMKWGDTSCPVCRHCMQAASRSSCADCGVAEDLWICLICGHVGCGRYKSKHAQDHWKDTQHCYALELDSQRVWDYVGDGYVHRLVQSKSDGKLVEVPSPAMCSGATSDGRLRSGEEKIDYDRDEAIVASKIDAVAFEYNHLLSAQLESQRLYFENILLQNRTEADAKLASMADRLEEMERELEAAREETRDAAKQRKSVAKKASELTERVSRVEEEKEFLRQLNETLISNQKDWKTKTATLEGDMAAKDEKIRELEEQARDLIVFIEAQKAVDAGGELQGGTLVAQETETEPASANSRRRRRGRR